jgi:hypothetical protein
MRYTKLHGMWIAFGIYLGLSYVGVSAAGRSRSQLYLRAGRDQHSLTDRPLPMNPEALAQSPLQNLPRAALWQLAR